MERSRSRQAAINIIATVVLKIFQIILPFLSRTIVIKKLGIEYVGLSGLFTSIIGVLSLAEMGAGAALVYSMYKPVKEKNEVKICSILNTYKKMYLIIGLVVTVAGLCVTPFLDKLIKAGTYPESINIYVLYIIYLINTVITYLVFAYKTSLLDAHQMGYLASRVKIIMLFVQYVLQIGVLVIVSNYYYYVTILPLCTLVSCVITGLVADKYYPNYRPKGKLNEEEKKEIVKKIKSLFLYKIGSIVLNSVDSIVISWFFGAAVLGIYNNYYYIVSSLFGLLLAVTQAITPSVGNSLVSKSKSENYNDFMVFSMGYNFFIGWCVICIICLMQQFIKVWIGEKNMLSMGCVFLFGIYFFSFRIGDVVGWYKDASGLWEPDRFRPVISSIINLILNISLIQVIGLYGVLLSTIIALLTINYPIAVRILISFFGKKPKEYVKQQLFSVLTIVIALVITYFICCCVVRENGKINLLIKGIICLIVPNLIMFSIFIWNKNFRCFLSFVKTRIIPRR